MSNAPDAPAPGAPPALAASAGDEQLQLDGFASASGPELDTVSDTQLWGADFGEVAP